MTPIPHRRHISGEVGLHTPEPEILHRSASEIGIAPEE
jgi:hypothetical protein